MADDDRIVVDKVSGDGIETQRMEIVERKGLGHPDSLADGISEAVSRALSNAYIEEFGSVAHHNTDEVQIIGGKSRPAFGGGTVIEPIYILLGGRAAREYADNNLNVHGIAKRAARDYLAENVRHLDVDEHVIIDSRIGEGSSDLTQLYADETQAPRANDTSFGVGHAPLSDTEELVLAIENTLNSDEAAEELPFLGEDVKVMANRDGDAIQVTVAAAFVDRYVDSVEDYEAKKAEVREAVQGIAEDHTDRAVTVDVNTADGDTEDELYLTVTGTSAEMGDDGSVGRGNRVSGLITPKRAMSLEASSGKNPVAHIGKIYNLMAHDIAEDVYDEVDAVEEAHVTLLSQIGQPINQPQTANVRVVTGRELTADEEATIAAVTEDWLHDYDRIMQHVIENNVSTF